jgi:hypothetical protein
VRNRRFDSAVDSTTPPCRPRVACPNERCVPLYALTLNEVCGPVTAWRGGVEPAPGCRACAHCDA